MGEPRIVAAATDPHLHQLLGWADDVASGVDGDRDEKERLSSAQAVLRGAGQGAPN
ncbi:hypothetical protein AB0L71_11125 [Streptomyces sp. NPDC052052]|uniref:hypothetical protein n=1 Tax=Streptomyces sp. NPDC052052 TaxID=3154756 RepID=UPI0034473AAC